MQPLHSCSLHPACLVLKNRYIHCIYKLDSDTQCDRLTFCNCDQNIPIPVWRLNTERREREGDSIKRRKREGDITSTVHVYTGVINLPQDTNVADNGSPVRSQSHYRLAVDLTRCLQSLLQVGARHYHLRGVA